MKDGKKIRKIAPLLLIIGTALTGVSILLNAPAEAEAGTVSAETALATSAPEVPAESIKLAYSGITTISMGSSIDLRPTVAPENATDKKITWQVSKEGIVTVDEQGIVQALAPGMVRITARCGGASSSATIRVAQGSVSFRLAVGGIQIVKAGKTLSLLPLEVVDSGSAKKITWRFSKEDIVTVDENGLLTAAKPGIVKVTASSGGKEESVTVRVTQ